MGQIFLTSLRQCQALDRYVTNLWGDVGGTRLNNSIKNGFFVYFSIITVLTSNSASLRKTPMPQAAVYTSDSSSRLACIAILMSYVGP